MLTKKINKKRKHIIRILTNIHEKKVDNAKVKMKADSVAVEEAVLTVSTTNEKVTNNPRKLMETSLVQLI